MRQEGKRCGLGEKDTLLGNKKAMTESKPDHFSSLAPKYAAFRPTYPPALFKWLSKITHEHALAVDCACGNGQASLDLAEHFDHVIAVDSSQTQIDAAPRHPRIEYRVGRAESLNIEPKSVDLIAVATALHWFDMERFNVEAQRILKPGGVVAAWAYTARMRLNLTHAPHADAGVNNIVATFSTKTVDAYWPPKRSSVLTNYRLLPFPYDEIIAPDFQVEASWNLAELLGYFRSWSATGRFMKERGFDPVDDVEKELAPLWGNPENLCAITWPLVFRVGRWKG